MKVRCPFCNNPRGKLTREQRDGHKPVPKKPCTRCVARAQGDPDALLYLYVRFGIEAPYKR